MNFKIGYLFWLLPLASLVSMLCAIWIVSWQWLCTSLILVVVFAVALAAIYGAGQGSYIAFWEKEE